MNWFFASVRSIGASFPLASSLVQFHAELDSRATQERLRRLEDPVSVIHPDVREISRLIYQEIVRKGSTPVDFDPAFYQNYRRPLAMLEAAGYIHGTHTFQQQFYGGFR